MKRKDIRGDFELKKPFVFYVFYKRIYVGIGIFNLNFNVNEYFYKLNVMELVTVNTEIPFTQLH